MRKKRNTPSKERHFLLQEKTEHFKRAILIAGEGRMPSVRKGKYFILEEAFLCVCEKKSNTSSLEKHLLLDERRMLHLTRDISFCKRKQGE